MGRVVSRVVVVLGVVLSGSLARPADRGVPGRAADPPTFSRDVAPLLFKHCTECHRPGEIAPMSLLTYEDTRPWVKSILDKVLGGTMPPWHADPAYGRFSNDRRLTQQEKDVLVRWAAAGAPKGDPADLPPAPAYPTGWTIGQPDAVLNLPTFSVQADGEVRYQFFDVPTNFTEDHWIQAMEVRPGNRSVVHHVLVFVRDPNQTPRELALQPLVPNRTGALPSSPTEGPRMARRPPLLATAGPGKSATTFPPGRAMLLKAGSTLVFQMHYTTNGSRVTDQSRMGFVFAKQPAATEVRADNFTNGLFVIPPGAPNHAVESGVTFLDDVTVYSLLPHTHLRGKSWEYRLTYPDGRTEVVLSVPRYDFNWQDEYLFAEPLKVPKGSVLKAVAHYDNSTANRSNPDPRAEVRWGDQTWEEMQYTGISYSRP